MAKLAADLDGMTMGGLASKGRYGDTMIAHINPQEAEMLMEEGGSGTINPMTGLPEFYFDDPGYSDADMSGAQGDITDTSGIGEDSEDDDYTQAELQEAEIDTTGLFDDPFSLYSDEGLGGDKFTLDPYNTRTGIQQQKQDFEKEGIPKEFVPYYNSLKDRGLTNEQAMATLAAVAGTPGGAGALSSGYTDGYSYGGPMGTLEDLIETGQTASLEQRAKKAREEAAKEEQEVGYLAGGIETETKQGFGDRFASILGLDDFSLASLNPLSNKLTPNQQAIMQSYRDQGLTVQQRSDMDNLIGLGISAALPIQLSGPKFLAEKATNTEIFGLAIDPATGFEYLIDNSGGLQLAPGQLGDEPNQDGGNEPAITAKRKATTEKPKEEKKKEASKEGFPQQKLPRFTPSDQTTIANIYGSDAPILDKYTTGIQALV